MTFDRVHGVGTFSNNKIRPIVAKFRYIKERKKAYAQRADLQRQNLGIGKQWLPEVRETRKALFSIMRHERS